MKAAKDGKIQLKDSFAEVAGNRKSGSSTLTSVSSIRMGIGRTNEPTRRRKLLMHRRGNRQAAWRRPREKGLTLIPTKMYLKKGRIKCEIAVAKGKKLHDKRESERTREMEAEARAADQAQARVSVQITREQHGNKGRIESCPRSGSRCVGDSRV